MRRLSSGSGYLVWKYLIEILLPGWRNIVSQRRPLQRTTYPTSPLTGALYRLPPKEGLLPPRATYRYQELSPRLRVRTWIKLDSQTGSPPSRGPWCA